MAVTSAALVESKRNPGTAPVALSTNRRTAAMSASSDTAGRAAGSGRASEGIRQVISPATRSGSRLVTSTVTRGQPRRTPVTSRAHASTRCSQLSSTNRTSRSPIWETSADSGFRCGGRSSPRVPATSCSTRSGSVSAASSTNHVPSRCRLETRRASSTASVVFPDPPEPISVSTRDRMSNSAVSTSSRSRPISAESSTARTAAPAARPPGPG